MWWGLITNLAIGLLLVIFDLYLFLRIIITGIKVTVHSNEKVNPRHVLGIVLFQSCLFIIAINHIYFLATKTLLYPLLVLNTLSTSSFGIVVFISFGFTFGNFRSWYNALCTRKKYIALSGSQNQLYSDPETRENQ